ncbi:MAG: CapA family protein [PVC group bacterium]
MISVLIAGDLCPIGRNLPLFKEGDAQALFNDLLPEFEQADLSIVNLECPLIGEERPIKKVGPVLGAPRESVNGLEAAGIDVVNLANNHILDHGAEGLASTLEACRQSGIDCVGAGADIREARKILVREAKGIQVGILALAEHEFGTAGTNSPGSNPLDLIDFVRNVDTHRQEFDCLIVLLHGGNEHYPYPRPRLMNICRFFVERGADAVICQQSHVAGCGETYRGGHIVYGQGNFIFDLPSPHPAWNRGVLLVLEIDGPGRSRMRMVPYRQSDGGPGARRLGAEEEKRFREEFTARSEEIRDPAEVEKRWREFCRGQERALLHLLHGRNSLLRRLAVRAGLSGLLDSKKRCLTRLHLFRCESLREALIAVLEERSKMIPGE